ncbi:MAG: molecular chaperone HtpG [Gammaproteobacteria bacterium]|nr:MAG: molecular chaperone HtpG [Gammaproteobacteria bacterium]
MSDPIETRVFETETSQLLQLMIHSLYSNKEIFLRELISNASDALDKLRYEGYQNTDLLKDSGELVIQVDFDKEAKQVVIRDNGVGMSRDEVVVNIGTIAHSGTADFAKMLADNKDSKTDANMIGQFGVGFYSSFIVADKVTVETRRADLDSNEGVRWESTGSGEYTLENIDLPQAGTTITLHLRDDSEEFADNYRIESLIRKYSDHITFPVQMLQEPPPAPVAEGEESDNDDDAEVAEPEALEPVWTAVNKATALWVQPRNEIGEDEYNEFYQQLSYDFEKPLARIHSRVEGKQEYTLLLYVPTNPPFDLYDRDRRHGIKLYVKRVFIMDDAEQLMPAYLRFVKGVIDSDDLPLNVSREILQGNKLVDSIRAGATRKVLDCLKDIAKDDAEKYQTFWDNFGKVLKEGLVDDFTNKERIAKLLRFATSESGNADQTVSLEDYVGRMGEKQEKIYYITADSHVAANSSPHLEVFRKHGIEVLLLSDPIDEWVVSSLPDFDGKSLQSVSKGELGLDELIGEDADDESESSDEEKSFTEQIKEALKEQVESVRVTRRLTDSPACLVKSENEMSANMERIMKSAGQSFDSARPSLEVNLDHKLLQRLKDETAEDVFADLAQVVFDQALLSEGGQLENPAEYVKRVNRLLA